MEPGKGRGKMNIYVPTTSVQLFKGREGLSTKPSAFSNKFFFFFSPQPNK